MIAQGKPKLKKHIITQENKENRNIKVRKNRDLEHIPLMNLVFFP